MIATLVRIEDTAAGIKTFWLEPERPLQYIAGQYTQVYLPHVNVDNRGDRRWFTLSSAPTEPLLAITTKFASGRSSSFKQALRSLPVGTRLQIAEPMGDFVLPKDPTIPLIFAAAGMGVTPVRSMLKYLLDSGEQRAIQLLQGVGRETELVFGELFQAYGHLQFTPLVSRPSPNWLGERGHLSSQHIMQTAQHTPDGLIYLSGPEFLVEKLDKELTAAGIDPARLVVDFFHGYADT